MAGMDLGNEKQMYMNVATKVILRFSDLVSAEKSVKKRTQFFSDCKTGTSSSKFVFYGGWGSVGIAVASNNKFI